MKSMTAFSRQEKQTAAGILVCECKSVNHRYLEMQFRLPEACKSFEASYRHAVKSVVTRGKLDITLYWQSDESKQLKLNQSVLSELFSTCQQLRQQCPDVISPNALEVLQWPGVLLQDKIANEEMQALSQQLLQSTLARLVENRQAEGQQLQAVMLEKLSALEESLSALKPYQDSLYQRQKAKLMERLEDLTVLADPVRIEQELVIWLNKADIVEELDRLGAHIAEVMKLITSEGLHGRRLDFLMQEFNREANTIAAKAQCIDATRAAVEIKVLVEQMREQVQNIE